jgi:hypothetical protein
VNCLVNSTDLSAVASAARRLDPNYFVAFAENSIDLHGCPTAISDNLFQDGTPPKPFFSPFPIFFSRIANRRSISS